MSKSVFKGLKSLKNKNSPWKKIENSASETKKKLNFKGKYKHKKIGHCFWNKEQWHACGVENMSCICFKRHIRI